MPAGNGSWQTLLTNALALGAISSRVAATLVAAGAGRSRAHLWLTVTVLCSFFAF